MSKLVSYPSDPNIFNKSLSIIASNVSDSCSKDESKGEGKNVATIKSFTDIFLFQSHLFVKISKNHYIILDYK